MQRKYNSDGINLDGGFSPVPAGAYDLIIRKVKDMKNGEQWKTKNGDDYCQVECEIDSPPQWLGRKVWYGVTFMEDRSRLGAGMAINFLKSIGEPHTGDFDIDSDCWIGKRFKAQIKIVKDDNGKQKNEIAYLISDDASAVNSNEVPF